MLKIIFYLTAIMVIIALMICAAAIIIPLSIAISIICFVIKQIIKSNRYKNINFENMTGYEFEHFCADLLRDNNFKKVKVTKGSGDHGVDILATKHGRKYAIQCKCYSSNIGNSAVQEVYSGRAIYDADVAVVMTNSKFTSQAMSDAAKLNVELWGDKEISKLIRSANKQDKSYIQDSTQDTVINPSTTSTSELSDADALIYAAMCEKHARERDYLEGLGVDPDDY